VKFLVDNQLPAALAAHLRQQGHDASHVLDLRMDESPDEAIWEHAAGHQCIVISKDEDFFHLANRPHDAGRLLWIRLPNCRRTALLDAVSQQLPQIVEAFKAGQRIVELR
jgi:predicted nuclease of predicted toxin-antitoxin system